MLRDSNSSRSAVLIPGVRGGHAGVMTIDEITEYVERLGGVLTLAPQPGDGSPEISWGDLFFYYAPTGVVPHTQPFATVVTKDYPDDRESRLDRPDVFRVNVSATAEQFEELTREPELDLSAADVVIAHPVYGSLHWVAVVNPGRATDATLRELLRSAHAHARERTERRADLGNGGG
jgi:hypothetical protein